MNFHTFHEFTMSIEFPVISSSLYVLYSVITNRSLKNATPRPRPNLSLLTIVMVLHNIILCIFSLITFLHTFPAVWNSFRTNDIKEFVQDSSGLLKQKLEFWIWLFYVSKVYEIIDSLILHWNKRPTSFLQMFHHAGAIICCWLFAKADTHGAWIFVVLNSFIHTVMYLYYLLVTLRVRISGKIKRLITRMQIIQFVFGVMILGLHLIVGGVVSSNSDARIWQILAISVNFVYVISLFGLFRAFEKRTYQKKTTKVE